MEISFHGFDVGQGADDVECPFGAAILAAVRSDNAAFLTFVAGSQWVMTSAAKVPVSDTACTVSTDDQFLMFARYENTSAGHLNGMPGHGQSECA
jgi:hypothetical protein